MMSTEGDKRIVLVSSMAHSGGVWDPSNLQGNVDYSRIKFYSNSKLYNVSATIPVVTVNIVVLILLHTDYDNVCITKKSKGLWNNCVLFTSRNSKSNKQILRYNFI